VEFPVYISLAGLQIHPHVFFEGLALIIGLVLIGCRRGQTDRHWGITIAGLFGALVGAVVLAALQHYPTFAAEGRPWGWLFLNKSIVGALAGGWLGIAWAKKKIGYTSTTGDGYVLSLVVGMMIGRLGCFFSGLEDGTVGLPSTLPWAMDFGDGPRHPTQLYDIVLLPILAALAWWGRGRPAVAGQWFRGFMMGYGGWRVVIDFLKPSPWSFSPVQAAALLLAAAAFLSWYRRRHHLGVCLR
jgi:phosphatidylglycerol---prolipoprotein diacylglyceryl transferase